HYTPRQIVDPVSRRRNMSPEDEYGHIQNAEVCKALSDAGVKVNIGGHGEMQGLAPHWELWMLTQGGMSPMEALRSATANGAAYLGMDQHLGSLRAGKLADMIILNADPLADIRNSINIDKVMMNGRLYQAATLDELGNHPQKRQPMYWRRGAGDETFMLQQAVGESNPGCGCGRH
ncbi:MAG TPA: amidohydrolase family protein, partial [Calditrichia bacterium]|nr:amidohydrolase family protein [Calditrichia bacterium]